MTRRNISLNFRRRILATISSLFQRRWVAPVRSTRRSRWSQRVREFSEQVRTATAASTKLVNSHLLTLGAPEFLETRKVMAGVDLVGSNLAVWADTTNEQIEIFAPISGMVRVVANGTQIFEGSPTNLVIFDRNLITNGQTITLGTTVGGATFGGSGYTTAPTVNLAFLADGVTRAYYTQEGTTGTPATALSFLNIASGGVVVTGGGTNFALNDQIKLSGGGGNATISVSSIGANGVITGVSLVSSDSSFTNLSGLTVTPQTGNGTGATFSATGRVAQVVVNSAGTNVGYFANPTLLFTGGGGSNASVLATAVTSTSTTGESVTIAAPSSVGGASGFTPSLSIGADPTAALTSTDIDSVNIATRLNATGAITVERVLSYQQWQSATATGAVAITTATGGSIDIRGGANLTGTSVALTAQGSGSTLKLNSGTTTATTGAITVSTQGTAGIVSTSRSYDAKTSLTLSSQFGGGAGNVNLTFANGQSLKAGSSIGITSDADVTLSGSPYSLTAGPISIAGDTVQVTGLQAITASGGFTATATTGNVSLDGTSTANITAGDLVDIDANTSVFMNVATSGKNVMIDASNGSINTSDRGSLTATSDIFLQAVNGTVKLDGNLFADDLITIIADNQVMGLGTVTATELLLTAGNTAQVDLTTSTDRLTATVGGGLNIANNKSLDVLAVSSNGNLSIATTGSTSDLTISSELSLGAGEFLNLSAGRNLRAQGSISSVENVALTATAGSITSQSISVTNDVVANAATGINMSGSVSARSFSLLTTSGDVLVSTQSPTGTVTIVQAQTGEGDVSLTATAGTLAVTGNVATPSGNVSLVSDTGNVNIQATGNISTPANRAVTVHALGTVTFAAGAKLVTGGLDFQAASGSTLLQSADASFDTLAAELTGKNNPLVVVHNSSLTVVKAETVDGNIDITLNNGDLSITDDLGTLPLPPTFVSPRFDAGVGSIALNAANGSVSSTQLLSSTNLDVRAQNTSTISSANVATFTGAITGSGQNLTATFVNQPLSIGAAGLTANGGALDLTITSGNLTRTGAINTAGGTVSLNVGTNEIQGTGAINTSTLNWTANQAPDATNLTYGVLVANQTGAGNLVIANPASLEVREASIANGAIDLSVASGNLTINGVVESRAAINNITLNASSGSILLDPSVSTVTANVLTVTAQNDLALRTNVNTLVGNITNGSFTVTETSGLVVGAAGINAADDVAITVLSGDLDRSNLITAGAGKILTMNVPTGRIIGNSAVAVAGGTLIWTAQAAPADANLTGEGSYAFLSANVTGVGENLTIGRTGSLTILEATTANGIVSVSLSDPSADLTINGPVTAGGGNAAYLDVGNRIVVTGTNLITAGYLNAAAFNDSVLRVNVTTLEGVFDQSSLTVVATGPLGIGANGVTTTGGLDLSVLSGDLTLTGALNASTASNVAINVAAGGISGVGQITANALDVRSSSTASLVTEAATLTADVTGGSLVIADIDDLTMNGVNAANDVNITVGGNITGTGLVVAGQNITLNASAGIVDLSSVANQVAAGNLLSLRANGTSAVNTAVGSVTATILNDGDTLTIVEGDDLTIDAAGILANGVVAIQAANLTVTGAINAGSADLAIDLTGNSSGAGVVSGTVLALNAVTDSSLSTTVSNLIADVTAGSLTVTETDALTIDGVNAATSVSIKAGGAIDGSGSLVAGTDITLNATAGGITLNTAQQINSTGDGLLSINAAGDVDVDVAVGELTATVTGGNLTVVDNGTLAVNTSGVSAGLVALTVASGELTVNGSVSGTSDVTISAEGGNITGTGSVTSTNNVALNAAAGITLSGTGQIAANVLTVTAVNSADLGTTITSLNATLTDFEATLDVTETDGLAIIAANAPGGINLTTGGNLNGTGLIDSGSNATTLDVTGSIDLASAGGPQVIASDLNVVSTGSADLNVAITSLNASVGGIGLTLADTDDLTIDGLVDAPTGNVTLTSEGLISGVGVINAAQTVQLTAGDVTLTDPAQIVASVLRLVVANDADVNIDVTNLVANVGQSLTVVDANNLSIGVVAGDEVRADSLDITVSQGNLNGAGDVNVATNVTLELQDSTGGSINLTTGRVSADNLTATVQAGSIDLNTAVANLTATTFQNLGSIVVNQTGDLTVQTIDTVDGNVNVSVASGNLTIGDGVTGSQGILGGQVSNVTLSATSGNIVTADAVVFGNVLNVTAQNSSALNTSVTSLVANITGAAQSLTIFEAEELTLNSSTVLDGLQIGSDGVTTAGGSVNITLVDDPGNNIVGGSLVVTGPINTRSGANVGDIFLDVANGSVTGSGLISGGFLNVAAQNTSSLTTSVDTLSAVIISGLLTVSEQNGIAIDATNGVTAQNVTLDITDTGNLSVDGDIVATTGDLSLSTANGNISGTNNLSSPANVTLVASGSIALDLSADQVSGNVLSVNATGDASLNTVVTALTGNVTGNLTIVEADDLSVESRGIFVDTGDLSIELTSGNLTGFGNLNVGVDVILNASAGNVTLTGANQVTAGFNLILTAQNTSAVNTSVAGLEANVTDGTLTIVEASGLNVLANGVVADNVSLTLTEAGDLELTGDVTSDVGDIAIAVQAGSVSGSGNINSAANVAINASGSVTLSAANQVTGNVLNLVAGSASSLGTNVTSLFANVSAGALTVNENDDLTILAQGAANGAGATNVTVTAGGDLTLAGNVTARTGDLNLTISSGNITGAGIVSAAGDVILSAAAGNVTLNGIDQVRGQLLTVNAQDDSAVNTVVGSLVADVTGGSLTVFEADNLAIASGNVNASDNVTITIANGNLEGGDASALGSITAGDTVNLVVNGIVDVYGLLSAGDPGFQGAISAQNLTIQSKDANIDTDVTTLVANITGNLTVNEETGLTIGSDVNATSDISLAANGLIDGAGLVGSTSGNVILTSVADGITLDTVANQVSGNVLSVFANLASSLETNVTTLVANITGSNESLTINEASSLIIGSGNVVTNDGDINITVGGNLIRTGAINADSGNVTLTAASGNVTGLGLITGNVLDVAARDASSLNTSVNTINAVLSGSGESLTVFETGSLTIDSGLTTANGNIAVTVGGDLDGLGNINAGSANVALTAATGDINVTGLITGNVLTLTAESANITTTINAIAATTTAGGLTLDETDALTINGLSIAGDVNLTVGGDIDGTGVISASEGASNVTLSSAGGITLSVANQIVGNVLSVTAVNSSSLGTKVNTLVADISGSGESLTVVEADGLTIGSANVATTDGNISITTGSLVVTGAIDAGTANVGLHVTGTVTGSGLIVGDVLTLNSTGDAAVSTDVTSLNAAVVTGTLTVTETDSLSIVNATASSDITLNAAAGTIDGTGPVNSTSGNVSLTATDIALTAVNQVRGNVLAVNVSGSADINTAVNTLTASNAGVSLNIVEANALTIGAAGINGANAAINLVTGGSLTFAGGIDVRPNGSVDLNVTGAISGPGQIKADTLNAVATASSTLNTSVNNLSARVTSTGQSLTITEADSLTITSDNVTTANGPISLTLTTGSLTVDGVLSAGGGTFGTVDLNVAAGRVNTTAIGSINGTSLNLRAQNTSSITTNVGTLTANITGSGQGLAVVEFDALTVGASGVRAANGPISINVGDQAQGSLLLSGPVNAGSGNVTLNVNFAISGSGLVTGNVLDVTVGRTASLNTQVNSVQGAINGSSQTLTISEADGINIGAGNLSATGTNGRIAITANGQIGGAGSIIANTGSTNISLNATSGGIDITGNLDAGSQGTVVLLSTGNVAMGSSQQITADTLVLNSAGSANVGTEVANLSAVVRNANATLIVSEYNGLQILSNGAVTNNGAIEITAGTGAAGNLVIAGPVNAVLNTVTLSSQDGGISTTGTGLVTGSNLFIASLDNVALATNVTGLAATVSGSGSTLTINEANDLTIINTGNVVQTTDGNIAITLATGTLSGSGVINAGTAGVTLNAANGTITLTGDNQVRGGLLTATANGSSAINTAVDSLDVTLRGSGSTLTIVEADDVAIDRITTANGAVSIRSLNGSLTGTGNLTAGTANVALTAADSIDITGTIAANNLTLLASNGDAAANTTVNNISANATGSITINETDNLTLLPAGLNAGINVTVNAGGAINGTGNVVANATSGQIILNAATGTTLTTRAGQVRGDSLLVAGGGVSTINTTVNNLAATLNGSLTVTETNGLAIDPDLNTSIANGNVTLNVLQGNLDLTSNITAGTGNVTLNVGNGSISGNGRITANQLAATAKTGINVSTNVNTLNATVSSTGNLTVNETDSITVLSASTTRGNISLTAGGDIETRTVTGRTAPFGNVAFNTTGNVNINGPLTTNVLNLASVGRNVTVLAGGTIKTGRTAGSVIDQTTPGSNGVIWEVNNNNDTGSGSLRTAITNVNGFQGRSQLTLADRNITVSSQLPTISRAIQISGNGNVTIQGAASKRFSGLTLSATNSSVDGIKLANFGAPALYLIGGRTAHVNIDVSNVTVDNSQIGIQAVNLLGGSTITNTTVGFSNPANAYRLNSYGIMLSAARGLAVGGTSVTGFGSANGGVTVSNVAIGIAATGVSTGSAIRNADISNVNKDKGVGYALSLASATGLTITASKVSDSTTGLFASGFCTGSTVSAMTYSSVVTKYSVKNSRNLIITN
jgi:hypothetical protein